MYKHKNILAIIPARRGSKSIPNKNLAMLAGKPLIGHTIAQARESRYIDRVIVSSDSNALLRVAKRYGAETIRRPKHMAKDNAKMDDAIRHALLRLRKERYEPDFVVILQPTSPLRKVTTVDRAVSSFIDNAKQFDSLAPLCPIEPKVGHIKNGRYAPFSKMNMQRQELVPLYRECGTVFVFKPGRIAKRQPLYGARILPFVIDDQKEALDINDKHDLELANYFLRYERN